MEISQVGKFLQEATALDPASGVALTPNGPYADARLPRLRHCHTDHRLLANSFTGLDRTSGRVGVKNDVTDSNSRPVHCREHSPWWYRAPHAARHPYPS